MPDSNATNPGKARWVGIEGSAYCVAKTVVLISMLQMNAPVDCVLQVGYSAAWSSSTAAAFRQAVKRVREGKTLLAGASHPKGLPFLKAWEHAEVSLAEAGRKWFDTCQDFTRCAEIGKFQRPEDRKALCAYCLSGQLLEGTTGSVAMFVLPSGYNYCRPAGLQLLPELLPGAPEAYPGAFRDDIVLSKSVK